MHLNILFKQFENKIHRVVNSVFFKVHRQNSDTLCTQLVRHNRFVQEIVVKGDVLIGIIPGIAAIQIQKFGLADAGQWQLY